MTFKFQATVGGEKASQVNWFKQVVTKWSRISLLSLIMLARLANFSFTKQSFLTDEEGQRRCCVSHMWIANLACCCSFAIGFQNRYSNVNRIIGQVGEFSPKLSRVFHRFFFAKLAASHKICDFSPSHMIRVPHFWQTCSKKERILFSAVSQSGVIAVLRFKA